MYNVYNWDPGPQPQCLCGGLPSASFPRLALRAMHPAERIVIIQGTSHRQLAGPGYMD